MPDLVRKNRSKIILNGDHPHVEARWENATDRRICVTVRPITRKLVRLVHEHSSGDFSKILYEGYVRTNAEEEEPLRVEVKQVNSIIDDFGAAMTFWSTGVPEQVE